MAVAFDGLFSRVGLRVIWFHLFLRERGAAHYKERRFPNRHGREAPSRCPRFGNRRSFALAVAPPPAHTRGMETSAKSAATFRTTRWSVVARAAKPAHPRAGAALADLCGDYWPPLYAFARRLGHSPQDAEDFTQGFFAFLIEKNTLAAADPARGKLRTFLLAAFRHHISDAAKREHALKRGGGAQIVSLDRAAEEECRALDPSDRETPETLYHRRWAMLLLERALDQIEAERISAGHAAEVEVLRPFLSLTVAGVATYEEAAEQLGWTVNAARVAVFRLRARYREVLLELVAATLHDEDPAAVETEMRELLAALGG